MEIHYALQKAWKLPARLQLFHWIFAMCDLGMGISMFNRDVWMALLHCTDVAILFISPHLEADVQLNISKAVSKKPSNLRGKHSEATVGGLLMERNSLLLPSEW